MKRREIDERGKRLIIISKDIITLLISSVSQAGRIFICLYGILFVPLFKLVYEPTTDN